ncbi:MAG: hypothetical protein NTY37_07540 [Methanothrix sp.]|nr:hypothetical protein [Methanothrix sp.]
MICRLVSAFDTDEVLFKAGVDRVCGIGDLDAFLEYFQAFSPVSPGQTDRIVVTG